MEQARARGQAPARGQALSREPAPLSVQVLTSVQALTVQALTVQALTQVLRRQSKIRSRRAAKKSLPEQ